MKDRIGLFGLFVAIAMTMVCADVAEARVFGRRKSSSTSSSTGVGAHLPKAIDGNLQAVAQARANAMASRCVLSHAIHTLVHCPSWAGRGVGEGIGCASHRDPQQCATCIVGSTVVADAHAFGSDGQVYRVRFFR